MLNAKAIIQYDGTNCQGWQIQANGRTIQGELTRVVSLLDHRHVNIHGAGRTDSGVHALGQVASFAIERDVTPRWLRDAINGNLDRDIRVKQVEFVDPGFHARLSAKQKTYEYRIWTGAVVSPFLYSYVYHCRASLNIDAMRPAADALTG
ncbi:MAG: tRNA pseudouridine synthase A [Blastocatellia bacterium]